MENLDWSPKPREGSAWRPQCHTQSSLSLFFIKKKEQSLTSPPPRLVASHRSMLRNSIRDFCLWGNLPSKCKIRPTATKPLAGWLAPWLRADGRFRSPVLRFLPSFGGSAQSGRVKVRGLDWLCSVSGRRGCAPRDPEVQCVHRRQPPQPRLQIPSPALRALFLCQGVRRRQSHATKTAVAQGAPPGQAFLGLSFCHINPISRTLRTAHYTSNVKIRGLRSRLTLPAKAKP